MTLAILVALIDFVVYYLTFCYQRGTLMIARQVKPDGDIKQLGDIQTKITPTWLGVIAILSYGTLIAALVMLWNIEWWYAAIYLFIRFVCVGLLPTFEARWANYIARKYKLHD